MTFINLIMYILAILLTIYAIKAYQWHKFHLKLYKKDYLKNFKYAPISIIFKTKFLREVYVKWLLENTNFGDVIMISNYKIDIDPFYIIMNDLKDIRREFTGQNFKYYIKKDYIGKDVVVIVSNNKKMSNEFESSKLKKIIESSLYFYNISHIKRGHSFSKESLKMYIDEIKELTDFEIEDEEKVRADKELIEKKTNIINSTDTVENKQIQLKRLNNYQ